MMHCLPSVVSLSPEHPPHLGEILPERLSHLSRLPLLPGLRTPTPEIPVTKPIKGVNQAFRRSRSHVLALKSCRRPEDKGVPQTPFFLELRPDQAIDAAARSSQWTRSRAQGIRRPLGSVSERLGGGEASAA
eukprot:937368-Rhodomonas_salina.1